MYRVEDDSTPHLRVYLCYKCGFRPNDVLIADTELYAAYQGFYSRFKDILRPSPGVKRPFKSPEDDNTTK